MSRSWIITASNATQAIRVVCLAPSQLLADHGEVRLHDATTFVCLRTVSLPLATCFAARQGQMLTGMLPIT